MSSAVPDVPFTVGAQIEARYRDPAMRDRILVRHDEREWSYAHFRNESVRVAQFLLRRLGSERVRKVDLRLVTATNRDLRKEVAAGRFREDLHYRLMQFLIVVPPLRERIADIAPLARRFLDEVALDLGAPKVLTTDALERLERHDFPGNVRELRNLVIQAAVWSATDRVTRQDVVRAIERTSGVVRMEDHASSSIVRAVEQHHGNLSAAARALGIPRSTLRDRLKRAGQT